MKKQSRTGIRILLAMILAAFLAGCGAATAPPVDLPAPVVGRISVGTPDASGKSIITGAEGAVTGDSIVLAINERLETSASLLWRLSDAAVRPAYAQSIPEICALLGHWCAVADDVGAFEMIVDAFIGDEIILVIIDEDGIEISGRISLIIPSTDLAIGMCDMTAADGTFADLINIDGLPIAVFEGSSEHSNLLVVGPFELILPGCHAASVKIAGSASTGAKIAVISNDDRIVWIGTLANSERFLTAQTRVLEERPLALALSGDPNYLAVALDSPSGFFIARMSLADTSIDKPIALPDPDVFEFTEFVLMKTMGPFADGGYLGMVVLKGTDGIQTHYFAHFFETKNFTLASQNRSPVYLTEKFSLNNVADAALAIDGAIDPNVVLLVTDGPDRSFDVIELLWGDGIPLPRSFAIGNPDVYNGIRADYRLNQISLQGTAGRLDVGVTTGGVAAYVLTKDTDGLKLMRTKNYASSNTAVTDFAPLTGASKPTLISVDSFSNSILVGDDALKDILDFTSLWLAP